MSFVGMEHRFVRTDYILARNRVGGQWKWVVTVLGCCFGLSRRCWIMLPLRSFRGVSLYRA